MPESPPPDAPVLVADIGGTHSRLGLAQGGKLLDHALRRVRNADQSSAQSVLATYLVDLGQVPPLGGAGIGIAGTIRDGVARMSNLDWTLPESDIRTLTGARRVYLLNDLQAQGLALDQLAADQVQMLVPGARAPANAVRLVVGIGTGFNASPVYPGPTPKAATALVPPSESGQAHLPLSGPDAQALGAFLAPQTGAPRIEDLLSGPGLARAYQFFAPQAAPLAPGQVLSAMATDPAATSALRLFARLLGRVVGDLACVHLPFGGIYLIGGVARALAPHLVPLGFEEGFHGLAHYPNMSDAFPVFCVRDDNAALLGAAQKASA